jgi:hypothetical protein
VLTPLDLYVARRPPSARHFFSQRVRQAYDDFAIPLRIGAFLAVLPATAIALRRGRAHQLGAAALASVVVAESGRRRAGGAQRFSPSSSLLAPVWVCERSVCSWLAVAAKLRGGVRYGEGRLGHAATPLRRLRRRYESALAEAPPAGGAGTPLSA